MTEEQHQSNQAILRNMATDLIEQYFLPTVSTVRQLHSKLKVYVIQGTFKLSMDENLIEKTLKALQAQTIDETLLDELQTKV